MAKPSQSKAKVGKAAKGPGKNRDGASHHSMNPTRPKDSVKVISPQDYVLVQSFGFKLLGVLIRWLVYIQTSHVRGSSVCVACRCSQTFRLHTIKL